MTPDSDLVARAPELEAQVMKTAEAGDRAGLFAHALALYRLADVRIRLGDPSAAVSLAQRAAAIWGGDRVADTEAVAAARALAAAALASIGRLDEAVAEFEGLVLQHAGFPKTTLPGLTTGALSLWLSLLQQSTDWEKLYEVAGLVRAHLDPESGRKDWEVWMEASVLRATAAGELGHAVESIELLEDAVSRRLDVEGPSPAPYLLSLALLKLADALDDVHRYEDSLNVLRRLIARFEDETADWARNAVTVAREFLAAEADPDC